MDGVWKFQAELIKDDASQATSIVIPYDTQAAFGSKGRLPVRGTLNGTAFRGSLFPYAGTHYLGVNRPLREQAGLKAGDLVEVVIERDDEPRELNLPTDLAEAIAADPEAEAAWEKLSFSHRREYVQAVQDAKKPETRTRRVNQAVAEMVAWVNRKNR